MRDARRLRSRSTGPLDDAATSGRADWPLDYESDPAGPAAPEGRRSELRVGSLAQHGVRAANEGGLLRNPGQRLRFAPKRKNSSWTAEPLQTQCFRSGSLSEVAVLLPRRHAAQSKERACPS